MHKHAMFWLHDQCIAWAIPNSNWLVFFVLNKLHWHKSSILLNVPPFLKFKIYDAFTIPSQRLSVDPIWHNLISTHNLTLFVYMLHSQLHIFHVGTIQGSFLQKSHYDLFLPHIDVICLYLQLVIFSNDPAFNTLLKYCVWVLID